MNNKELNKKMKRLLNISYQVVDIFDALADLAYHNNENSQQFLDFYEDLKKCINSESVIVNNLSLEQLEYISKSLKNYDDNSDGYNRLYVYIEDKIDEYYLKNENNNEDKSEYDDIDIELDDDMQADLGNKEISEIEKYYIDEEDTERYEGMVTDNIALVVLKNMYDMINNTFSNNKGDNKYKKRLLRDLKAFKYIVFCMDRNLEIIGINYKFDINKIPVYTDFKIDASRICHNDCVDIISRLYDKLDIDYDPSIMNEMLFNYMIFLEYLNRIDDESVDKLLELCYELEEKSNSFYGQKLKETLIKKKKN